MYEEMPAYEDLLERARECIAMRSNSWVVDATLFARWILNEEARRQAAAKVTLVPEGAI